ncbi:MAG: SIMPL domain-containing protein [Methanosarcinaceae archaeon]|nr:SIMPL domain-containing protein [Methanosarcinaceae archaeon]
MQEEAFNKKLYTLVVILAVAVTLIAACLYAIGTNNIIYGPTGAGQADRTISVSGSASTTTTPDTASMSVGVIIDANTAKEASDQNAAAMSAVISELRKLGLQDEEIQTSYLSVQPVYEYPVVGAPTIVRYSALNNVQITTTKLDKLSDIIDGSTAAGANQIGSVSFTVSDEKQKQLQDELVIDAANDASARAEKMADSLNVRIVGVKASSIIDGGYPQPIYMEAAMYERAATPILPGESKVTLSIQVTYIIE